jgi:hypothetical protein
VGASVARARLAGTDLENALLTSVDLERSTTEKAYVSGTELAADESDARNAWLAERLLDMREPTKLVVAARVEPNQVSVQGALEVFQSGSPGERVLALHLLRQRPEVRAIEAAEAAITEPRTMFERYHGLLLADALLPLLDDGGRQAFLTTVAKAVGDVASKLAFAEARTLAARLSAGR